MTDSADLGDRCPVCKNEVPQVKRLRLENELLRKQLEVCKSGDGVVAKADAEIRESDSSPSSWERDKCHGQKVEGEPEETAGMKKQNDSSQMKALLSFGKETQDTCSQYRMGRGHVSSYEDQCPPSTHRFDNKAERSLSGLHLSDLSGPSSEYAARHEDKELVENVPLSQLNKLPSCYMQLDKLSFSSNHTVLVNVSDFHSGKLIAQKGQPRWDNFFVKLPYAKNVTQTGMGETNSERWENISKYLSRLSNTPSTADVEAVIKKYNPKYKDQWSFDALHSFFKSLSKEEKNTVSRTLNKIAKLALKLPEICAKAIPLLRSKYNHAITLSQLQIACLLANAFYCTFPHRNATHRNAEYSNFATINFSSLFSGSSERKAQKFKALFIYFGVVTDKEKCPHGLVTFKRHCLSEELRWEKKPEMLTKLHISSEGTIEEKGAGMLQVDFACSLLGGGVLGSGLVQEEILFLIHPELIVARLFTERLDKLECLKITGVQQYSSYTGYSDNFKCTGPYRDTTTRDEWQRLHRQIVAIDAMNFKYPKEQYDEKNVLRELNKAYCGFQGDAYTPPDYLPAVATGNWGCGAFNGDPRLKALIQLMAAAAAQRDVAYFTFKDCDLERDVREMHHFLLSRKVTVGRLYQALGNFCMHLHRTKEPQHLYRFIRNNIADTTSRH